MLKCAARSSWERFPVCQAGGGGGPPSRMAVLRARQYKAGGGMGGSPPRRGRQAGAGLRPEGLGARHRPQQAVPLPWGLWAPFFLPQRDLCALHGAEPERPDPRGRVGAQWWHLSRATGSDVWEKQPSPGWPRAADQSLDVMPPPTLDLWLCCLSGQRRDGPPAPRDSGPEWGQGCGSRASTTPGDWDSPLRQGREAGCSFSVSRHTCGALAVSQALETPSAVEQTGGHGLGGLWSAAKQTLNEDSSKRRQSHLVGAGTIASAFTLPAAGTWHVFP